MTITVTPTASELLADSAQVALVRDLLAHARTVRAQHHIYPGGNSASGANWPAEHTWTAGTSRVLIHDGWLVYLSHGAPLLKVHVTDVRQVAQLLAAIGVLPQRFTGGTFTIAELPADDWPLPAVEIEDAEQAGLVVRPESPAAAEVTR